MNKAKKGYLIRHSINVVFLFLVWIIPDIAYLRKESNGPAYEKQSSAFEITYFLFHFSVGLFLSILRLSDKYFGMRFKNLIISFFRLRTKSYLKDLEEEEEEVKQIKIFIIPFRLMMKIYKFGIQQLTN